MKLFKISLLIIPAALIALSSCESDSEMGNSLINDKVEIIMDSSFTVTGKTVDINKVVSRTATQLLGAINAKQFGALKSDFVAEFMPPQTIDVNGVSVETIDSIKLVMKIPKGSFVGDSLIPMGLKVFKLSKQLPSPIYSDFDPSGYYSPSDLIASKVYTASAVSNSDTIAKQAYRTIDVMLPLSLGKQLYQKYIDEPSIFADPTQFAKFFPGFYVANSYGEGRISKISETKIQFFYHKNTKIKEKDTTIYTSANYFAVTPEVISNNNMRLSLDNNISELEKAGKSLIVAPIGKEVEITFPTKDILAKFNEKHNTLRVVNSLFFEVPAQAISNHYKIAPPAYLLLVLKSKKEEFFSSRSINDDKTSFYAAYNASTHSYTFSNMREYIINMIDKDEITDEDIDFVICPVSVTTETINSSSTSTGTTYTTAICPYVEKPAMAILNLNKAKVRFTFTRQNSVY